jgi:hypothetical protein
MNNNRNIATKNFSIDTIFRENYNNTISTDFSFNLPYPIEKVISMRISAMELPNVWRSFSEIERTNTFKITVYNFMELNLVTNSMDLILKREFRIEIPPGNYTSLNFENMINAYFLNTGKGLEYIVCNIDQITTKTTFRAFSYTDDGTNLDPYDPTNTIYYSPEFYYTLDFSNDDENTPIYNKTGWMLGFKKEFYTVNRSNQYIAVGLLNLNNQMITYYGYLDSESSYGSSVYPYVYLDIDEYQENNRNDSLYHFIGNSLQISNNIIARISISSSQNTIIIDNGSDTVFKKRNYIGPITIDKLHIKLLNRFGNIINLLGNDYSFILEITYLQ